MDEDVINEDMLFDRINFLLEGSRLPFDIRDMEDLEKFVGNPRNKGYGIYKEVKHLYNEMSGGITPDNLYGD